MEIAIIADDTKKELMTQFCIAYCGILSRHHLCATSITGKFIADATGLDIEYMLPGDVGGVEQIASRIALPRGVFESLYSSKWLSPSSPSSSTMIRRVISSISPVALEKLRYLQPYIMGGQAERICTARAPWE